MGTLIADRWLPVQHMKILAISGSLRRLSLNTMVLRAAARAAPDDVEIELYDSLADIPPFNPDIEPDESAAVSDFRDHIKKADGVLICSPEYAHGVSGVLKNALDWVVGSGELAFGKPVAILNVSLSSQFADTQLRETIKTMDAYLVEAASILIPVQGKKLDETGLADHTELGPLLRSAVTTLADVILARQSKRADGINLPG